LKEEQPRPRNGHLATYWPFYLALLGFLSGFLIPERYPSVSSLKAWVIGAVATMACIVFSALAVLRGRWWVRVTALGLLALFVAVFIHVIRSELTNDLSYSRASWPVSRAENALPARHFNSGVAFRVSVLTTVQHGWILLGDTPANRPLWIPPCLSWRVEPLEPVNIEEVVREVEKERIHGLRLRNATDEDLARLKGLQELRELFLTDCKRVTDEGISNVKDLPNLNGLDISYTGVSDAGLRHLDALKALEWIDVTGTSVTPQGLGEVGKRFPEIVVRGKDAVK